MPSPREGILEKIDWEAPTPDLSSEWTVESWKPASSLPRYRRTLSLVKSYLRAKSPRPLQKMRPTAYLDGLRGFAAFMVYWHHHQLWAHGTTDHNKALENAFGYEGNYYFATLPFIRNFFTGGHYAVATFFVISGYVLSLKPLTLIQAGDYAALGDNLASALFRRWLRLYIPLIIVLLAYATSWHAFGIWVDENPQQGSWRDELWAFYIEFKQFSFIFKEGGKPWITYNQHLWSIPVEFKGSIVVFTTLLALSRASRNARLWCQVGLIVYFMHIADGWYCAVFLAGMLLCDLDLLARKGELPRFLARLEPAKEFIFYHLLIFSMFLGGIPAENNSVDQLARNRGWYYLSFLKPQAVFDYKWFFLFWAAVWLVVSIPRIPWLRRIFETRPCQWLGRVSFALYLVHGPVLWVLGSRIYLATGWLSEEHMKHIPHWANKLVLPKTGPVGLEVAFLVPHIILLPVTLGLAELVTKTVDTPSVKFANWLYKKTLGESPIDSSIKQAKA